MKKIAVICLSLIMLFSATMTVLAAPGAFVSSPSRNAAPELVDFENETDDCTALLKITSYSERNTLDAAVREKLELAYSQIVDSVNGNDFSKLLETLAKNKGMNVSGLSVSDLFDLSSYDCDEHENHDGFVITLKSETFDGFVGLAHLNGDEWEIAEVRAVNEGENSIKFYVETLSPFAVVIDNGTGTNPPQTGDNSMIYIWVILAAASGLMVILISLKKQKA